MAPALQSDIQPARVGVMVPSAVQAGMINHVGSSTVGKFVADASNAYTQSEFKLNTKPESPGGEQCAVRKSCELGGIARGVNGKLPDQGVVVTLVGEDAIVAVVHADETGRSSRATVAAGAQLAELAVAPRTLVSRFHLSGQGGC